jgi:hypothetical protein
VRAQNRQAAHLGDDKGYEHKGVRALQERPPAAARHKDERLARDGHLHDAIATPPPPPPKRDL